MQVNSSQILSSAAIAYDAAAAAGAQVNEAKGPAGLGEVRKAYEYSADRIGQGAGAGPLWAEYLAFLQARADAGPAHGKSVTGLFARGAAGRSGTFAVRHLSLPSTVVEAMNRGPIDDLTVSRGIQLIEPHASAARAAWVRGARGNVRWRRRGARGRQPHRRRQVRPHVPRASRSSACQALTTVLRLLHGHNTRSAQLPSSQPDKVRRRGLDYPIRRSIRPLAHNVPCGSFLRLVTAEMRVCRRAYQRAIAVPTDAVDDLWRAYEAFEFAGPNKTLAKRLVDEHRPVYQLVRRLLMLHLMMARVEAG